MFINNFDPVAFQIMSLEIRWYSLAYIFGIIIGWLFCKKIFIKNSDIKILLLKYQPISIPTIYAKEYHLISIENI